MIDVAFKFCILYVARRKKETEKSMLGKTEAVRIKLMFTSS